MRVAFYTDGQSFLEVAKPFLAVRPVECSVLASVAELSARFRTPDEGPSWFAVLSDDGGVVGAAMRTHPDPPHAGFTLHLGPDARSALLVALIERGERVPAWTGEVDTARALCEGVAGGRPVILEAHTRLFEATHVRWPCQPVGSLRAAQHADEGVVMAGYRGYFTTTRNCRPDESPIRTGCHHWRGCGHG